MVGARVHRLDLKHRLDHRVDRLPAADSPSVVFCQVTIASQARASMSSGNSWTIVSSPWSRFLPPVLSLAPPVKGLEGVEIELLAAGDRRWPACGLP